MAQLFVYTHNSAVRFAVNSLVEDKDDVIFFDNRLQFLVCATILKNANLLIDALHGNHDDIRWLYPKLKLRGIESNVHYLVPSRIVSNSYMKDFSLITDILGLKTICRSAGKRKSTFSTGNLRCLILKALSERMSDAELEFILTLYDGMSNSYKDLTRKEINKLYYIRRKLFLQNATELKQLILLLSEKKI